MSKVLYLCDKTKCDECFEDCKYTADPNHAACLEYLEEIDTFRQKVPDRPCLITEKFEPYCRNCALFEPRTYVNDLYANGDRYILECVLTCENWKECSRIAENLKHLNA